jgi:integrase
VRKQSDQFSPYPRKKHSTGQARIRVGGCDHYLGAFGSQESRDRYEELRAAWLKARKEGRPAGGDFPVRIVEDLCARFWIHAKQHYRRPDGSETQEVDNYRQTIRPLRALHAQTPIAEFGPRALKEVRQAMLDGSWLSDEDRAQRAANHQPTTVSRKTANQRVDKIRRMFRWGVAEELIPHDVYERLRAVTGLQKGRCAAREYDDVPPADDAAVEATLPYLGPVVGAMVRLQRLTGMRPGEVCRLVPAEIDRQGPAGCWIYRPGRHKTAHRGKLRQILLGPRAQQILAPFLERDPGAPCFAPAESVAAHHQGRTASRKLKSSRARAGMQYHARRPMFTPDTYYKRVARACLIANRQAIRKEREAGRDVSEKTVLVPHWHPNQLRHTMATQVQHEAGIDAARAVLGHADPRVSLIYAARDIETAAKIISEIG